MNNIVGGSADHLLCENLFSFAPAVIIRCQPLTVSLITNTTEDCRQALVHSCQDLKSHLSFYWKIFDRKNLLICVQYLLD